MLHRRRGGRGYAGLVTPTVKMWNYRTELPMRGWPKSYHSVCRGLMYKVAIVGSGFIGSTIASVLASSGCDVDAIDVNERLIAAFERGDCPIKEPGLAELCAKQKAAGRLRFGNDFSRVADADVILVTVGTPLAEDFTPDISHIHAATEAIVPYVRDGQLVMVKSTVPPGITRVVVAERLRQVADVLVAFSPERLAEGTAIRELSSLPIVVGGLDAESSAAAETFWKKTLGVNVIVVSSPEAAEVVKLADNLWIDLNIALAHDLAKLCDALPYDLDVLEVIAGANSLKKGQHYVNILTPSNGVGGYCLTKDPWFVHTLGTRHGTELLTPQTSRAVNAGMPAYCASQIAQWARSRDRLPSSLQLAVLGLAFKTNSGDVRLTPVMPLLDALQAEGFRSVRVHDPMVRKEDADDWGVVLNPSMDDTLRNADGVIFLVGHDDFKALSPARIASLAAPGALVFDGRRYFDRSEIAEIQDLGFAYKGVGR
ncbi:nucleotide sugar dehydrogenase [Rhizobiaceae bacterium n13]|uniref:Nucleotide sugar dehydrogenase n=1 Tax=Ferirhizobium litorale TaxID=2927786 RepID=A0AAE3Q9T1_9HYPH|nr:nucleotide sugar dehydrogenase [Fererhizobium litorale]MDI7860748.1 nucleotide sugar dehydrogenase [Fererhizobium litorale]MDI7920896.1 nucleotide sugar dehydrogenase [Fererhizobium litorale]